MLYRLFKDYTSVAIKAQQETVLIKPETAKSTLKKLSQNSIHTIVVWCVATSKGRT